MPSFYSDAEVDVDVHEFMDACSRREIEEVIDNLKKKGYLSHLNNDSNMSLNESEFEDNLSAISGNYVNVTKEEEENISKIAKRFKFQY
jgi:hypothetical protein